jgi:superoxide reductase
MKFYVGNDMLGNKVVCEESQVKELVANSTDAANEKHIPVVTVDGNKVTVVVGEVEHPMTEAHLIQWIVLETKKGSQKKVLSATDAPRAEFTLEEGDEAVAAYEYCNLHGLWKKEI